MLIKDWEYDAFLKSILNYSAIIIHGPDRGKVSEKVSEVISTIKSNISGPIDIKDILSPDGQIILNFETDAAGNINLKPVKKGDH